MTKEDQIDWLCRLRAELNNGVIFTPWNKEFTEALTSILEQKPCDDAISRRAVLDATVKKNSIWNTITNSEGKNLEEIISQLPPFNPLTIREWELVQRWRDGRGISMEEFADALDALQRPKSECEHDHEILKAYSDGASAVLDKIRAEIEQAYCKVANDYDHGRNYGLYMAMQIIDKYKTGSGVSDANSN